VVCWLAFAPLERLGRRKDVPDTELAAAKAPA
jgi:hypothetical protein